MDDLQNCQCSCGNLKFNVSGEPLLRIFCHCTICQNFNQAPFGDVTIFRSRDVEMPNLATVEYLTHSAPPAVQRGKCMRCQKPGIEYMSLLVAPKLVIVPSVNIHNQQFLPVPSMHIFYHSRVADIDDELPKYEGYWSS
ncbi:MAG: GFA family protein, partial [Spongiibacteraceae bacterium]